MIAQVFLLMSGIRAGISAVIWDNAPEGTFDSLTLAFIAAYLLVRGVIG